MSPFGIDVRGGSGLLVRAFLQQNDGSVLSSGTTNVYFEEPQNDGTLKSYDFNDNTFKTGALTTPNATATHRQGAGATRNTGLWTYVHPVTTGFVEGNIYFVQVENQYASPPIQTREFQYGSGTLSSVVVINSSELTNIADSVLKRDFSAVTGEAGRSLLNAARFIRNKWYVTNTDLYVTKEDDTTTAWTAVVQGGTSSGISSMDPS